MLDMTQEIAKDREKLTRLTRQWLALRKALRKALVTSATAESQARAMNEIAAFAIEHVSDLLHRVTMGLVIQTTLLGDVAHLESENARLNDLLNRESSSVPARAMKAKRNTVPVDAGAEAITRPLATGE